MFNPNLAGGSSLDANPNMRGAFAGLDLGHSKADLIRAVMEGVALGLRQALNELRKLTRVADEMIVVGGMAQGPLWREILADAYNLDIVKTNVNQEAAALGAAAVAAVGSGIWDDFGIIEQIHQVEDIAKPDAVRADKYAGRFDDGWDAYRERSFQRAKELGWIPADAELTPRHPEMAAWDDIPDDQKPFQARLMEVCAGFAEHVDVQAGKVIDEIGEQDVTLASIASLTFDVGTGAGDGTLEVRRNRHGALGRARRPSSAPTSRDIRIRSSG